MHNPSIEDLVNKAKLIYRSERDDVIYKVVIYGFQRVAGESPEILKVMEAVDAYTLAVAKELKSCQDKERLKRTMRATELLREWNQIWNEVLHQ